MPRRSARRRPAAATPASLPPQHARPPTFRLLVRVSVLLSFAGVSTALNRKRTQRAPPAAVFVEPGQPASDGYGAELLRFVTAYGAGLEAAVDATPFAPLLESAVDNEGNLNFYAFVDTWVGNDTGSDIVYMDNVTGVCYPRRRFYGNGWSLSLDLVLWPVAPPQAAEALAPSGGSGAAVAGHDSGALRPKLSVALASGYFGGNYAFGVVDVREAKFLPGAQGRPSAVEFSSSDEAREAAAGAKEAAAPPRVFECPRGRAEASLASLLGYFSQEAGRIQQQRDRDGSAMAKDSDADTERRDLADIALQMLTYEWLEPLNLDLPSVSFEHRTATARYNASRVLAREGMPVFFRSSDVVTDVRLYGSVWWNLSYPFQPVGQVVGAEGGVAQVRFDHPCLPSNATHLLPRFVIPVGEHVLPEARALVEAAMRHGEEAIGSARSSSVAADAAVDFEEPLLLEPVGGWSPWYDATGGAQERAAAAQAAAAAVLQAAAYGGAPPASPPVLPPPSEPTPPRLVPARLLGRLDSASADAGGADPAPAPEALNACVVTQRRQGHIFSRRFDLGELAEGDRSLLQLAVTGHGWSATSSGCGEYCHAVYQITLNGQRVANITEWRDDCRDNPINGSKQRGTWDESRNGWCPGSVEPGVFFDITPWAKAGANDLEFNVVVWNNASARYEQYTDFAGFAMGDQASLVVGMSAFVYGRASAEAVLGQDQPFTAAERALRDGCSRPEALHPPPRVERRLDEDPAFLQRATNARGDRHQAAAAKRRATARFDFEARAPWYGYEEAEEGMLGSAEGAVVVPIFANALVQSNSRMIRASVKGNKLAPTALAGGSGGAWARAALWFRLGPPGEREYDHWDRVGSVGVLLHEHGQTAEVRLSDAPSAGGAPGRARLAVATLGTSAVPVV